MTTAQREAAPLVRPMVRPMVRRMLGVGILALAGCASNTVSFYAENDSLHYGPPTDANYTNGLQIALTPKDDYEPCDSGDYEFDDCETTRRHKKIINKLNVHERKQRSAALNDPDHYPIWLEYGIGQQMYTPNDLSIPVVQPLDRPYAGWTFGFLNIHNDHVDPATTKQAWKDDSRYTVQLRLGMVGPMSGADTLQKRWHQVCGCTTPTGWHLQLRNEVGIVLGAAREQRFWVREFGSRWKADALWKGEVNLGNVYTHADLGGTLRFGYNLPRDFSPKPVGPVALGRSGIAKNLSVYAFAGILGRAVGRDIFLDGNTFRSSPHSVDKENFFAEGQLGAGIGYGKWSLRMLFAHRTDQFKTQTQAHRFGSVVITRKVGS